ncbi:hypothetical protein BDQ12DRAFT_721102 [Crucibulum laeve]|uniref:Uncharacterized protein n=1 Tax=Crucibulum laeve TaxID=68775 RepID=A0A5C3M565_9AGAR|nr:hypothetical protein BDQ12DRAFT_721102 [Crucibulum laeve]
MLSSRLVVFSMLFVMLGVANALPTENDAAYKPSYKPPTVDGLAPAPGASDPSPEGHPYRHSPPVHSPTKTTVTPTAASPTLAAPTCTQPTLSANEASWSNRTFIEANLPNPLTPTPIFWSGTVGTQSVVSIAERCSTTVSGATVGMMMCTNGRFTMPNTTTPAANALWNFASEVFANHTSGRAYTVLGTTVNPNGTWRQIELPALKRNTRVTSVIQLDRTTCGNECYWWCPNPARDCAGIRACPEP